MLFILLLAFIVISVGLAWFLIAHDHGQKEPIGALWLAVGFGMVGALVASFAETKLISSKDLLPGTPLGTLLGASFTVGVIEEACKFIPLALVIYKRNYFNEHTDGVIYFALAGLGFGLPENLLYTIDFGTKTGMVRLFLTPMFHAAITGMVGYFLAKNKLAKRSPFWVIPPLLTAMALHGLYDFGLTSGITIYSGLSLLITFGVSIGLFVLFLKATEQDQDMGLSVVGHNSFCRSCGWANPKHHLYCIHCGKHA